MAMHYGTIFGIEKPISRLVQGTASYSDDDPQSVLASLDTALDLGFNAFDTASCYGEVKERLFGRWVRERDVRDKVVIIAKGAHHSDRPRVTPEDITTDLTNTLEFMELPSVDLYILHRDDPNVPVGPIVEILNEHKKAGRIDAFGGSNWSHSRIAEANAYAKEHGLTPFAVSSPNFSLAEQVEEPWENCVTISGPRGADARAYYAKEQTPLFTWSSLAGGFWSGRFDRDAMGDQSGYFDALVVKCYSYEQNFQRLDRAKILAAEKGISIPQVAMSYVMSYPLNVFALVFCADRTQFEANSAALDVILTDAEMAWLDLRSDTRG